MQPAIEIHYSSANSENSIFGIGWSLSLGSIQRTSPRAFSATNAQFQYAGPMGVLDLVNVGGNEFRPKLESGYTVFHLMNGPDGAYWVSSDKSGIRTTFGFTPASRLGEERGTDSVYWAANRIEDLSTNYTDVSYACDGKSLAKDESCHGSGLTPETISYAGNLGTNTLPTHCVVFRNEARPERAPVTIAGRLRGALSVRVHSIETYPLAGSSCTRDDISKLIPESHFDFAYDQGPVSMRSRLIQFSVYGKHGGLAPAQRYFEYFDGQPGYVPELKAPLVLSRLSSEGHPNELGKLHVFQKQFADISGTGVPGLCYFNGVHSARCFDAVDRAGAINPSSIHDLPADIGVGPDGHDANILGLFYPSLTFSGKADVCALLFLADNSKELDCWLKGSNGFSSRIKTPIEWPAEAYYSKPEVDFAVATLLGTIRFVDLNGDGVADICSRTKPEGLKCYQTVPPGDSEHPNTISFAPWVEVPAEFRTGLFSVPVWGACVGSPYCLPIQDPDRHYKTLKFVDLNNDGYLDICARLVTGIRCYLYDGKGWNTPVDGPEFGDPIYVPIPPPNNGGLPPKQQKLGGADWTLEPHYISIQFADIDGDGFPDICARDDFGVVCYRGLGDSFEKTPVRGPSWAGGTWETDSRYFKSLVFVDLNGDGMADLCANGPSAGLECTLSNSYGLGTTVVTTIALPAQDPDIGDANSSLMYADVNGDGKIDICFFKKDGLHCLESDPSDRTDFMRSSRVSAGATWTLEYAPSTSFRNTRLPFPLPLLRKLTHTASIFDVTQGDVTPPKSRIQMNSTTIDYEGGYFNPVNRDFLGFSHARVTEQSRSGSRPGQIFRDYFYYQHQELKDIEPLGVTGLSYLKGRVRMEVVSSSAGATYSKTEYAYAPTEQVPAIPQLTEIRSFQCHRLRTCGEPSLIRMAHDQYGNTTMEQHFGDRDRIRNDVRIETEYWDSNVEALHGLPRSITTYGGTSGSDVLAQTKFYYDEPLRCDPHDMLAPPPTHAVLRRGLLSRQMRLGDTGRKPSTVLHIYDDYGNETCVVDANGNATLRSYDLLTHSLPVESRDAAQHISRIEYELLSNRSANEALFGQIIAEIDPNGATITYNYDEFGRLLRTNRPDKSWIATTFNDIPGIMGRTVSGSTSDGQDSVSYLDEDSRLWRQEVSAPEGKRTARLFQFDSLGQLASRSEPYFVGGQPMLWSTVAYDEVGHPERLTDVDGSANVDCFFDRDSIHIGKNGTREKRSHDAYGRLTSVAQIDDAVNVHLDDICDAAFAAPARSTQVNYDRLGRVRLLTTPGGLQTHTTYDDLGRIVRVDDPDRGSSYADYDAVGNVLLRKNAMGQTLSFTYDSINRLTTTSTGDSRQKLRTEWEYRYDEGNAQLGRLTSATSKALSASISYDLIGNKTGITYRIGKREFKIGYAFLEGKLRSVTYPDGYTVDYRYDKNALVSVIERSSSNVIASFSDFNTNGDPQLVSYYNGVALRYMYGTSSSAGCPQTNNLVCKIERIDSGAAGQNQSWGQKYEYDVTGLLSKQSEIGVAIGDERYKYDFLGQLVGQSEAAESRSFEYDEDGNIIFRGDQKKPFVRYGESQAPDNALFSSSPAQASSKVIFAAGKRWRFDAAGRLSDVDAEVGIANGPASFQFGNDGRLINVAASNFQEHYDYDWVGNRVIVRGEVSHSFNIGNLYECSFSVIASRCARHIYAGSLRVATQTVDSLKDKHTWYYLSDRRGSVSAVTNDTGIVVQRTRYTAYGAPTRTTISGKVPKVVSQFGLLGERYSERTRLYLFGARYYAPELGRFISADEGIQGVPGSGSYNRYSYAFNNPASLSDASGECPWCFIAAAAVIGGLMAGSQSNWDFNAVLKGMVIGAIAGGFGAAAGEAFMSTSLAAEMGAGAGYAAGAIGGAVSSTVSTMAYDPSANPLQAAANGALLGAIGYGAKYLGGGSALVTAAASTAIYGGNFGENAMWGYVGNFVNSGAQMLDTNEDVDPKRTNGHLLPSKGMVEVRVYRPADWAGTLFGMAIGSPFSHVALAFDDGTIADQTIGTDAETGEKFGGSARYTPDESGGGREADLANRPYRVVSSVPVSTVTLPASGIGYSVPGILFSNGTVCTTYVSWATNNQVTGLTPGAMYWQAYPRDYADMSWARPHR